MILHWPTASCRGDESVLSNATPRSGPGSHACFTTVFSVSRAPHVFRSFRAPSDPVCKPSSIHGAQRRGPDVRAAGEDLPKRRGFAWASKKPLRALLRHSGACGPLLKPPEHGDPVERLANRTGQHWNRAEIGRKRFRLRFPSSWNDRLFDIRPACRVVPRTNSLKRQGPVTSKTAVDVLPRLRPEFPRRLPCPTLRGLRR